MKYDFTQFVTYRIAQADLALKRLVLATFQQEGFSITVEQWIILTVLYNTPNLIQSEIATITQKDKTNVTRMLDVLEKHGYIKKAPSESDRRSVQVSLTDQGEDVVSRLIPFLEKLNQKLQGDMTTEELDAFLSRVDRLRETENMEENK